MQESTRINHEALRGQRLDRIREAALRRQRPERSRRPSLWDDDEPEHVEAPAVEDNEESATVTSVHFDDEFRPRTPPRTFEE